MAAREDERETLVRDRAHLVPVLRKPLESCQELGFLAVDAFAPDAIDRAVACGGDDPGARIPRAAVAGPALERRRECILDGVLGELEVPDGAREDADCVPPLLAEDLLDGRLHT